MEALPLNVQKSNLTPGLSISLDLGPFQNNGASPWYARIGVGTPAQQLRFSFDTGSNFIWADSTLSTKKPGKQQFSYSESSSFSWLDRTPLAVSFGPWGNMTVETGHDTFSLMPTSAGKVLVDSDFYLSKSFGGQQFDELDWDGGIGMPSLSVVPSEKAHPAAYRSHSKQSKEASFHLLASLIEQGSISKEMPYLAFDTDRASRKGTVSMGELNSDYQNSLAYLFLPFTPYSIAEVSYIWTTKLTEFKVGEASLAQDIFFALDSGSSQYKGDADAMFKAFLQTLVLRDENLTIKVGQTESGEQGVLTIPPTTFQVEIEEGESKGLVLPQFKPMKGLDDLILVGSVLMDYLYTVYEYSVIQEGEKITLQPVGMWIFNKPGGLNIIQNRQQKPADIFNR
jgi:hypothetical protein